MEIRVTPTVLISQAIASAQQEYSQLGTLQAEADTGLSINQISDNPLGAIQVMIVQGQNARLDSYNQNIDSATTTLNLSVSTLTSAAQLIAQAQDLASQGANTVNDATTDQALADQVDSLLPQLVGLANTQSVGQYLYGGANTQTAPFEVTATDSEGNPSQVVYRGSSQRATTPIGVTQSVDTYYTGNEIFQSQQRGPTVITDTTGATAGSGTDSATGQGTLVVAHTSTTYDGASGVQAGTSSAAGDTIIGPDGAHALTINDTSGNGSAGSVSLDGGPAVAFTNSDTNLRVTNSSGQIVYVNTSAITPGFNGTVNITANGTLSTDGGKSTVAIDFSGNQVVTNSATGAVTNIDSTKITQTGTDEVSYTGTYDAFQILETLRDTLRNVNGLSPSNQTAAIEKLFPELDRIHSHLLNVVGEQSASLQNLQALGQQISSVQLQNKTFVGNTQSADIASVAVNLQEQQNLLELTLSATARLFSVSLLNFL